MTAHQDTLEAGTARPEAAPALAARLRPFWWSVRREIWENRSVWVVPLAAAGLVLLGFALNRLQTLRVQVSGPHAPEMIPAVAPYAIVCAAVLVPALVVAVFYASGALLRERRDRSILFWKSLPVSNLTVVLSKAAVPMLAVPAAVFAVVVATHALMLAAGAALTVAGGQDPTLAPATLMEVTRLDGMFLYALVTLILWQAPVWGYLLMVSAWAKARPLLWALAPWVALSVLEKIVIGGRSSQVSHFVNERLLGGLGAAFYSPPRTGGLDFGGQVPWPELTPIAYLTDPQLWIGLASAAGFIAAAAWLRRRADPI
jgi:ABC-2 type transport system permease protein